MLRNNRITAQQEATIGRMVRCHPAYHEASSAWADDGSLILTTAKGTEATVKPDGKIVFNIILVA